MSFYSPAQSFYSVQGWYPLAARTPAPPRDHFGFPLSYVQPVIGATTLGLVLTGPVWF